ncbi:Por secretion system C-terminal sorting domain-containing protein [Zobellia uliginosa]|uniref:Por secretion system C-terminal sorting domain-containing protein n=1 Tax=Zobellia uliginosa TaxID=143224 RepID=A0ABY1KMC4_9FLAO|nr:T9SS type A sorting domain-containing protein [Zobellia uliginosa]SIS49490.1 Por secretion system C-terminal sorting domain-containing protein [Zobellia uliginosa]
MKKSISLLLCLMCFTLTINSQTHNWKRTNPGGGGWFGSIGVSQSGIILAGSDLSGAYRSRDGGATWDVCGDSKGIHGTHISGMGFHKTNGNIMFVASDGLYKTTNGGDTWRLVLSEGKAYISDIEFGTNNPSVGYAARHQGNWNTLNAEIWRTKNVGNTWERVDVNLPKTRIIKIVVNPKNENEVYILTGKGRPVCSVADVYKSTDGGANWKNLTANNNFEGFTEVADFAIDPNNPNVQYLTAVKADCSNRYWTDGLDSRLYKSTNAGRTWNKIHDQGGIILINPKNSNLRIIETRAVASWNSRSGTLLSTDRGNTFQKIADVSTWETSFSGSTQGTYSGVGDGYARTIAQDPSNPDNLYWTNSQWVLGSKDGGVKFRVLHANKIGNKGWQSTGVDNLVNVDMAISPKDPNLIYLGLADMGIWRSLNKGVSWENCNTDDPKYGWGDGKGGNFHSIVADPSRANVVWVTCKEGYILKSTDKGEKSSWTEVNRGILSNKYVNGLSMNVKSPSNNRILYVTANGDVYKSTNDGNNWTRVLKDKFCNYTAVDQFNGEIVYAGGTKGLWRSTNGGRNWSRLNQLNDLPANNETLDIRNKGYKGISDIVTDPNHQNWVYVAVNGFGENRGLFRSKDKGNTWKKLLTDKYMRKVAIMPKNSNIIYATSSSAMGSGGLLEGSNGIWFSNDGGNTWSKQNQKAAYPLFNAIDISNEDRPYVLAGSQGTGFQKAKVYLSSNTSAKTNAELLPQEEESNKISVYPNPVEGRLHATGLSKKNVAYTIINSTGQHVAKGSTQSSKNEISLDVSSLPKGIYFLSIENKMIRFLVEK